MRDTFYIISLFLFSMFCSCSSEAEDKKNFTPKFLELNHHIINDSIEYKIIETEFKNFTNRKVCVYKNDSVISETTIYNVQKRGLISDSYHVVDKKQYTVKNDTIIIISDYKMHHNNYKLERVDTVINKMTINEFGDVIYDSLRLF